ncbi:MAG: cysteine synthase A [Spirochaetaceae bacterium]|nr:cysteine synthase A [Spirochaetaceae bacterium]
MLVDNFTKAIGNTPLVRINKMNNSYANIFAKVESMNPLSSAKDRAALYMIEKAETRGDLKKDSIILEPTSGNTGVGLAYIAAIKGYKAIFTMPSSMSEERVKLLKAFGAEIILTDPDKGMSGAIDKANELAKENSKIYIPQQFNNSDNPLAHYETTAPEIYNDLEGNIDIFVSAVGTGGTLTGCAKYFKEKNSNIKVVAVEPLTSAVISKEVPGKHGIQGIGAGFIPKNLDLSLIDETLKIDTEEAYESTRNIAKSEGMLVGISSGAALVAALIIGNRLENKGKNIVVIFPDTGERYLSTELFK